MCFYAMVEFVSVDVEDVDSMRCWGLEECSCYATTYASCTSGYDDVFGGGGGMHFGLLFTNKTGTL